MIGDLILGALAGFVASYLYKKEGSGCLVNLLLGVAGGWLGGSILGWLGFVGEGSVAHFVTAVIGAVILLWLWNALKK